MVATALPSPPPNGDTRPPPPPPGAAAAAVASTAAASALTATNASPGRGPGSTATRTAAAAAATLTSAPPPPSLTLPPLPPPAAAAPVSGCTFGVVITPDGPSTDDSAARCSDAAKSPSDPGSGEYLGTAAPSSSVPSSKVASDERNRSRAGVNGKPQSSEPPG